jgi:hypothetical protein
MLGLLSPHTLAGHWIHGTRKTTVVKRLAWSVSAEHLNLAEHQHPAEHQRIAEHQHVFSGPSRLSVWSREFNFRTDKDNRIGTPDFFKELPDNFLLHCRTTAHAPPVERSDKPLNITMSK